MKLMTQYDYTILYTPQDGTRITLVQLETDKRLKFYIANPKVNPDRVDLHMQFLTDTLCEQFFDDGLSPEEKKAKQAARKAQAKLERQELEAKVAAQKAESDRLRAIQKAEEKAKKAAKHKS